MNNQLVNEIVKFGFDFNTYDFLDQYETLEDAINQIADDLQDERRRNDIAAYLQEYLEEAEDLEGVEGVEEAKKILAQL